MILFVLQCITRVIHITYIFYIRVLKMIRISCAGWLEGEDGYGKRAEGLRCNSVNVCRIVFEMF